MDVIPLAAAYHTFVKKDMSLAGQSKAVAKEALIERIRLSREGKKYTISNMRVTSLDAKPIEKLPFDDALYDMRISSAIRLGRSRICTVISSKPIAPFLEYLFWLVFLLIFEKSTDDDELVDEQSEKDSEPPTGDA